VRPVADPRRLLRLAPGQAGVSWLPTRRVEEAHSSRREFLCSPKDTLCKSILLVNSAVPETSPLAHSVTPSVFSSRYILVVLQYVTKLDTEALAKALRAQSTGDSGASSFKLNVAPAEASDELSGFVHNAITPFGMSHTVPVVVSRSIADRSGFIWLGGGEVDFKLRIPVKQLLKPGVLAPGIASGPVVLDCTPRREAGDEDDD
jgi:prolyl-tRNA editing enzyme YbaK/EbsC (Cys-tRNA(Pro) deacylase)